MKYKSYIHEDFMSENKKKEVEKLAKKVMRFAQKHGLARLSFAFLSKEIGESLDGLDYIDISVNDKTDNRILNMALWG